MADHKNRPTRLHLITTPKRPDVFMGTAVPDQTRLGATEDGAHRDHPSRSAASASS